MLRAGGPCRPQGGLLRMVPALSIEGAQKFARQTRREDAFRVESQVHMNQGETPQSVHSGAWLERNSVQKRG